MMKPKTIVIRGPGCCISATVVIHKHLSLSGVPGFALHTSHFCLPHGGNSCYRVSHIGTGFSIGGICDVNAKTAISAARAYVKTKRGKKELLRVIRKARKMIKEAKRGE